MELIGITGHTSGIGKAIHDLLTGQGFKVLGFSRFNGFDLTEDGCIERIVGAARDCKVFINNVHSEWAQTELLLSLFKQWQSYERIIINIGSNSADGIKNFAHPYATQKAALDHCTLQLNNIYGSRCRVSTIKPGWVNTDRIADLKVNDPKLEPRVIAELVLYLVQLPRTVNIPTLTVQARN